jgi:hypothetical protein
LARKDGKEEGVAGLVGERGAHVHDPLKNRLRLAGGDGG